MKNVSLSVFFALLSLCFFSNCSSELEKEISYKEYNLKKLQALAKDVKVEVEIELYDDKKLSNEEFLLYKQIFNNIAELNGKVFELKFDKSLSRAYESYAYYGTASYEGNPFTASVYWKKDNQTGDVFDVYGGLGGQFMTKYEGIYGSPTIRGNVFSMIHYGQTLEFVNSSRISIILKADYVVETYTLDPSGYPDITTLPLSRIISKVVAIGDVDIINMNGSFTVSSAGEGSWGRDNLEILD